MANVDAKEIMSELENYFQRLIAEKLTAGEEEKNHALDSLENAEDEITELKRQLEAADAIAVAAQDERNDLAEHHALMKEQLTEKTNELNRVQRTSFETERELKDRVTELEEELKTTTRRLEVCAEQKQQQNVRLNAKDEEIKKLKAQIE